METKTPKTRSVWIIQGNYGYGHGWEDLCEYDSRAEAKEDYRLYRENEPEYPHRLIQRRVKNTEDASTA